MKRKENLKEKVKEWRGMIFILGLTIFCIFYLQFTALGSNSEGTTGANFLKLKVGARGAGMGGAFCAIADDVNAVYWNPAGLGQLERKEVSLMYLKWWEGINYQFMGYVHPLGRKGVLGGSVYYLTMNDIDGYSEGGMPSNNLTAYDLAVVLSYGRKLMGNKKISDQWKAGLFGGINIKLIQEKLDDKSAVAYALDIGSLYKSPVENLSFGFNVQNLGGEIKFVEEGDELPLNIKVGTGYRMLNGDLLLAIDYNLPNDNDGYINTGVEYWLWEIISLRLGYGNNNEVEEGISYGLGMNNGEIGLDYAFEPYEILGDTHRISISWRFGKDYRANIIDVRVKEYNKQGVRDYRRKDYIKAYQGFKNILVLDSDNKEAKEYVKKIQKEFKEVKTNREIEEHLELGIKYYEEGKTLKARDEFEAILALVPEQEEAKEWIVKVRTKLEEYKEEEGKTIYKAGLRLYKKKRYDQAREEFQKVLFLNSRHQKARYYIYIINKKIKEKGEEQQRREIRAGYLKAMEMHKEGELKGAIKELKKVLKLDSRHKKAKDFLVKVRAELRGKLSKEYYEKGVVFYNEGKLEEAIVSFKKVLKLTPRHEKGREDLEKAEIKLKQNKEAAADKYYEEGLETYNKGKIEKATELWNKALEFVPEHAKTRSALQRVKGYKKDNKK
ncbi:PorV/PorQ family protein [bacterium]|nr:PorV/PorQ family protein [bacterium]